MRAFVPCFCDSIKVTYLILLAAAWAVWFYPFIFRAPHGQKREHITVAGPTRLGLLLECTGIAVAFVSRGLEPRTGPLFLLAAVIASAIGIVLAWTSVTHLGKQFRVHAGLYADHELVRTGPYGIVRHPIYAALLAMLLSTIFLLTPWQWAIVALVLYIAGTEIRVRTEDKLLAGRFGAEFERYRQSVPAYLPFVR
jgi:protein-S-isoprenylcysteine O-methyltransferase Ste14